MFHKVKNMNWDVDKSCTHVWKTCIMRWQTSQTFSTLSPFWSSLCCECKLGCWWLTKFLSSTASQKNIFVCQLLANSSGSANVIAQWFCKQCHVWNSQWREFKCHSQTSSQSCTRKRQTCCCTRFPLLVCLCHFHHRVFVDAETVVAFTSFIFVFDVCLLTQWSNKTWTVAEHVLHGEVIWQVEAQVLNCVRSTLCENSLVNEFSKNADHTCTDSLRDETKLCRCFVVLFCITSKPW